MAQVAIQGGRYAAAKIVGELTDSPVTADFAYHDKGSMAVISRFGAVAKVGGLQLSGFPAWFAWLFVHLLYVVGFKHRLTTLLHWAITFIGRARSERVTTEQQLVGRLAVRQLGEEFRPTITGIVDPGKIKP